MQPFDEDFLHIEVETSGIKALLGWGEIYLLQIKLIALPDDTVLIICI